jgi:hypothetical protein
MNKFNMADLYPNVRFSLTVLLTWDEMKLPEELIGYVAADKTIAQSLDFVEPVKSSADKEATELPLAYFVTCLFQRKASRPPK